ncbi:glucosamine inositolphosphorylceramide transferase family protein, partial [Citrobacter sp. EBS8]
MQTKIKKIIKTFFYHESWDIMILKDHGSHLFPDNTLEILSKTTAQQLKKKYTFQADPFIVEKADKLYVFYEAFSFRNSKGMLRCRVLDRELTEIDDVKLEGFDDLKCHLSFPFLIHINDQLFMIPESSERKEV